MQHWIEVAAGLRVTGDGVAWLPEEETIVVADVHVGYELAVQRRGGYLPPVARGAAVGARLAALARSVGANRVILAGDLRHSTRDVDDLERAELDDFAAVVRAQATLDVVLGNHDRGDALVGGGNHRSLVVGTVTIVHQPPATIPSRWTICGHLHPRVTLSDETGVSAAYRCALIGVRMLVLPAFSDWAGGTEARQLMKVVPAGSWRILPVIDGSIADLGMVLHTDR